MTLQSDIQAVIDAADIQAGVAIWHIESGEQIDVNGSQPFPMASVFKIPILATAARQLQAGKIHLDDRVTLADEDKSPGSGILPFFEAGLNPTVRDLVTLMIIISDNTATDITVRLLGGPLVIEETMRALDLNDIHIKMDCKTLIKMMYPPEIRNLPLEEIRAWSAVNDLERDSVSFRTGPENNVSTALDMTRLVYRLYQGEVVDGPLHEEMIGILLKQQLNDRLPRFLPDHVKVAHKTGTIAGIRNDSGVIYVNDDTHVIVTLFTGWDDQPVRHQPEAERQRIFEIETAIGQIGLLIFKHYGGDAA